MARGFRLSATQLALLKRLHEGSGWEAPPGGYSTAGRDASRWWRTIKILMEHYLLEPVGDSDAVRITDGGRACVSDKWRSDKAASLEKSPVERLRKAILSAASFLQEIPVGEPPAEDTFDFLDADVRAALSALEEIQDALPHRDEP